jgi:hypothetical protein
VFLSSASGSNCGLYDSRLGARATRPHDIRSRFDSKILLRWYERKHGSARPAAPAACIEALGALRCHAQSLGDMTQGGKINVCSGNEDTAEG